MHGVYERMLVADAQGFRTEELESDAAAVVRQHAGDRAELLDGPLEVFLPRQIVGKRQNVECKARATDLGRTPGHLAEFGETFPGHCFLGHDVDGAKCTSRAEVMLRE